MLAVVFPNFQVFDFSEAIGATDVFPWTQFGWITIYGLGYAAVVCGLAAFSFKKREIWR